jgi:hypothetical protein
VESPLKPLVKPAVKTPLPPVPAPEVQADAKAEGKSEGKEESAGPPQTGAAPGAGTSSAAPTPSANGQIQLAINATEPVWVTATADGKTVIAETMSPGTSKTIAAEKQLRLTLGNAGGVEITLNGKKLEPVGPKGAVRTVDFTPWGAQVLSRTPPNPDPLPPSDPLR